MAKNDTMLGCLSWNQGALVPTIAGYKWSDVLDLGLRLHGLHLPAMDKPNDDFQKVSLHTIVLSSTSKISRFRFAVVNNRYLPKIGTTIHER